MLRFNIGLRRRHIAIGHLKIGVSEHLLETEDIPPGPQILDGKGMRCMLRVLEECRRILPSRNQPSA